MGVSSLQQGAGTDWSKMTPQLAVSTFSAVSETSPTTLLNISGKGMLSGVSVRGQSTSTECYFRVTIDGVLLNTGWVRHYGASLGSLPALYYFKQSLKVEAYTTNAGGLAATGAVSYNIF